MCRPAFQGDLLLPGISRPVIGPRDRCLAPEMWFRAASTMCGGMPSSAMPVAQDLRKSCRRHAGISMVQSRRSLALLHPLTGVRPVVVNTSSVSPPRYVVFAMISWAIGASGTTCGRRFLVRKPGMFQAAPSSLNSARRMPATSFNRHPVSSNSLSTAPNGSPAAASVAAQNLAISALLSTRSRACGVSGRCTVVQGLNSTRRCCKSQRYIRERQLSIARARDSVGSSLRRSKPGAPRSRVSATTLWMSWPSISITGRSRQRSASPPWIISRPSAVGWNPSNRACSRQRRTFLLACCSMNSRAAAANVLLARSVAAVTRRCFSARWAAAGSQPWAIS